MSILCISCGSLETSESRPAADAVSSDTCASRLEVVIDLTAEHTSLERRTADGTALEPPRGVFSRVGDRIRVEHTSEWSDTYLGGAGMPAQFTRVWGESALGLVREGSFLGPSEVKLRGAASSVLCEYRWDSDESRYEPSGSPDASSPNSTAVVLPWVEVLRKRTGEEREWAFDPAGLVAPFAAVRIAGMGYGRRKELRDWPLAHLAIVPEIPPYPEALLGETTGVGRARLVEARPDKYTAEIELSLSGSVPVESWISTALADWEWDDPSEFDAAQAYAESMNYGGRGVQWTWEAGGVLEWDPRTGVWETLKLTGEVELTCNLTWKYPWDAPHGMEFLGEHEQVWRGTLSIEGDRTP